MRGGSEESKEEVVKTEENKDYTNSKVQSNKNNINSTASKLEIQQEVQQTVQSYRK